MFEETKLSDPSVFALWELTRRQKFNFVVKNARGASGGLIIGLNSNEINLIASLEWTYFLSIANKCKWNIMGK